MPKYPPPKGALPKRDSCGAEAKPGCTSRKKKKRGFKMPRKNRFGYY